MKWLLLIITLDCFPHLLPGFTLSTLIHRDNKENNNNNKINNDNNNNNKNDNNNDNSKSTQRVDNSIPLKKVKHHPPSPLLPLLLFLSLFLHNFLSFSLEKITLPGLPSLLLPLPSISPPLISFQSIFHLPSPFRAFHLCYYNFAGTTNLMKHGVIASYGDISGN